METLNKIAVLETTLKNIYVTIFDANDVGRLFEASKAVIKDIRTIMPEWTRRFDAVNTLRERAVHKFQCDMCKGVIQDTGDIDKHQGSPCRCSEGGSFGLVLEEEV